MKKTFILSAIIVATMSLTACYSSQYVSTAQEFDHQMDIIKSELAAEGYNLTGVDQDSKNEVYVEAVSYSRFAGYGSKMNNNQVVLETYTFTKDKDNTLEFQVSFSPKYNGHTDIIYYDNLALKGCKTNNAETYNKLCGSSSSAAKINNTPKTTEIKIFDYGKSFLTALGICAALLIPIVLTL